MLKFVLSCLCSFPLAPLFLNKFPERDDPVEAETTTDQQKEALEGIQWSLFTTKTLKDEIYEALLPIVHKIGSSDIKDCQMLYLEFLKKQVDETEAAYKCQMMDNFGRTWGKVAGGVGKVFTPPNLHGNECWKRRYHEAIFFEDLSTKNHINHVGKIDFIPNDIDSKTNVAGTLDEYKKCVENNIKFEQDHEWRALSVIYTYAASTLV